MIPLVLMLGIPIAVGSAITVMVTSTLKEDAEGNKRHKKRRRRKKKRRRRK